MTKFNFILPMIKQIGIFILLMSAMVVSITGCEKDTKSLLIGRWELVESNVDMGMLSVNVEYFSDGTGIIEANVKDIGQVAENFTWKIDGEGRLITITRNQTQIETIVEISKSTLVVEGNAPPFGYVREKYSKLKKGEKSGGAITYNGNRNGENKEQNEVAMEESEPMTELRREAEKWIKKSCSFEEKQGEYFSFSCGTVNPCTDCGSGENKWTATSEVEIGDCPAGSVWVMIRWAHEGGTGGNNEVPPECKSITPKAIIDFNFSESYE